MHLSGTLALLFLVLALPGYAGSNVAAPAAAESVKRPCIAAVLASRERLDAALIAQDTPRSDGRL